MGAVALPEPRTLPDPRTLLRDIAAYARPRTSRSLVELALTAIPFALFLALMWVGIGAGYWIALLLAVPAGVMLVRLFMIQHDCGHGSFFRRRAANDWLGRVLGVLTVTPYDYFKRSHALHHARTGNLDHRGIGDVATLTVREYQARSRWGRFVYRVYRNPVVLFGIGPAYLFFLQYRLPVGLMRGGWRPWMSTMATNAALALFIGAAIWWLGALQFLLVYVPVVIVASTIGVWLFYVQHQFEGTQWDRDEDWSFHEAALHGSSHYDLPGVLRWLTANIGIHHIHHLSSRIPFYRLGKVLRDRPELRAVSRLTLRQSLRTVTLALWDEEQRRLVTFRQAKALRPL